MNILPSTAFICRTMREHGVSCLLMGGQACVFYGAAEFSKDVDLAVLADAANAEAVERAFEALQAERIAVPPFALDHLQRGLAIHFRCQHPSAVGMRVDIMARMRGVDDFPALWSRRTTATMPDGAEVDLLSLPDLVKAKKTQRDKDWPMITRLVDVDYLAFRESASPQQVEFWLGELRTPELLVALANRRPEAAQHMASARAAVAEALRSPGDLSAIEHLIRAEEQREREADRAHWLPLRAELERLRRLKA